MSYNIAITSYFISTESSNPLRESYLIPYFRKIQQEYYQILRFFAVDWWSLKSDGTIRVLDILDNKIIDNYQVCLFHLVHIFRLGYFTTKDIPFTIKWLEFESRLDILEITYQDIKHYKNQSSHILLQPFISEIHQGKISIVYIGRKFFCAALKRPKFGNFRTNRPHVGATITKYEPSIQEINLGLMVLEILPQKLEILRLDYVITSQGPLIMEIEAIDPSYYTTFNIMCAQRLSDFYIEYLNKGLCYE